MNGSLKCVLLIDDDEDDNYFHRMVLEESAHVSAIKTTENGFDALEFIRQSEPFPELIFLDANMPKMNGWEFLEEYKKHLARGGVKSVIIMLTTSFSPIDRERAKRIPEIDGYEIKPLTTDSFKGILERHFSHEKVR